MFLQQAPAPNLWKDRTLEGFTVSHLLIKVGQFPKFFLYRPKIEMALGPCPSPSSPTDTINITIEDPRELSRYLVSLCQLRYIPGPLGLYFPLTLVKLKLLSSLLWMLMATPTSLGRLPHFSACCGHLIMHSFLTVISCLNYACDTWLSYISALFT